VGSKRRVKVRSVGGGGGGGPHMHGGGREKARGCVVVSVSVPSFPLNMPFRMVLLLESTYSLPFSTSSGGASSLAGTT
jgi:hypothetical protein